MGHTTQLPVVAVTGMAFEARIASGPGVVAICGGHAERLAAELAALIAQGCRGIVSFGIAGGLTEHAQPGTCIVGRSVVHGDGRFESHLEWASRLLQSIPGSVHADIAAVHAPVISSSDKVALGRSTGASAVDMESHLCARAAATHGLPFAVVRVVADPWHRALPPAAQIGLLPNGKPDMPRVMRSVMQRPHQVAALIRVGLDTRNARAALVRARRQLGPGFGLFDPVDAIVAQPTAVAPAD